MSLQQAAALTQNPILKGLQAGKSAYNSPLATSIEASLNQAQQQRAQLGLNPAGSYPLTDTSAAAYQYLHGQGQYPYQPVTQGPTTVPYEQAHGITGPQSQAALAQAAKDAPWLGSSATPESTVKTKPSAGSSMLAMALPAAIAYKYLAPNDLKKWVADKTGVDFFGPSAAKGATTGGYSNATTPEAWGASADATDAAGAAPYDMGEMAGVDQAVARQAAAGTTDPEALAQFYGSDMTKQAVMNPAAGEVGYVYNPVTGALEGATESEMLAASIPAGTAAEAAAAEAACD